MMEKISHIISHFPQLSELQRNQFVELMRLYPEWNAKINVISRKDIDNLEINHILHSLAIAKFIQFQPGTKVLDFGTGGGFPAIPLAIMFPDVSFHLIDRVGKKLRVAEDIAGKVGLNNVTVQHGDIGECRDRFDFVVSRAVMPLPDAIRLCRKNISTKSINAYPNGIIVLKGGDINSEIHPFAKDSLVQPICNYFEEPFFETKKIIYTQI